MRVPDRERGAALLTVLLLVAVIAVMAAAALERLRLSTRLGGNAVVLDQARGYAYAAETLATSRVTALLSRAGDRVTLAGDWSGRPFGLPVPGGAAVARVSDGGNCFNLNSLVSPVEEGRFITNPTTVAQFARLATMLRVPDAAGIAASAADWIDSDGDTFLGGAEDGSYRGYRTGGTLLADVSELRAIRGVTPEAFQVLRPWVCTLPFTDRVALNINTLLPEQAPLLAMLLPDTVGVEQARGLLLRRPPLGYNNVDQFWNQLSLNGGATPAPDARAQTDVRTQWFALAIDVTANGAEIHEDALIDARTLPARLVARQWGDAT